MGEIAQYLFHHVFLPAKLPHSSDGGNLAGERALTLHLAECAQAFCETTELQQRDRWHRICRTLDNFIDLHATDNRLSSEKLQSAFQDLKCGDSIILNISLQNSALIIWHQGKDYHLESFETSAPAANVLAASTALKWDFPSQAVQLPAATFNDTNFQTSLSDFLEKSSVEHINQFAAKTLKAGSSTYESRDTPLPAVIGQLLVAILEANGRKTTVECTRKRVYDDVCWSDGSETPWRRSPTWLAIRVGLQRCLIYQFGEVIGTFHYKMFMAYVLARLCDQYRVNRSLSPDLLAFARKRVGRRAAKLRHRKEAWADRLDSQTLSLLDEWAPKFLEILTNVNTGLEQDWTQTRARTTKKISPIPRRADASSTSLKLLNSLGRLFGIINEASSRKIFEQPYLEHRYRKVLQYSTWTTREFTNVQTFLDYHDLTGIENNLREKISTKQGSFTADGCVELLQEMRKYYALASKAYMSDPQQSSLMVLLLMELWQAIDASAIRLFPLLAKYGPNFPADLLHVLQLASMADMKRLCRLELYLEQRNGVIDKGLPSIFGELRKESFQVQFFDSSESLQRELTTISKINEQKVSKKRLECHEQNAEYIEITTEALELSCLYTEDDNDRFLKVHNDRHCRKCYLNRVAKRMKIDVHEALLPSDTTQAKSLVFELYIPEGFAAWRDATWLMLRLGDLPPKQDSGTQTKVRLPDLTCINGFNQPHHFVMRVSLASSTKSHYSTHYKSLKLPVTFEDVCRPHAPRYALLDYKEDVWTSKQIDRPSSFPKICSPLMPHSSVYFMLRKHIHPILQGEAVTPNMIIAGQTECPNTLSMSEFLAFQDLRLGNGIQWIRLARELASSNLNFGTPEVYALVSELALMAGAMHAGDPLRKNHWVFGDPQFCCMLSAVLRKRLEAIAPNWREGQTMECLVLLIERLWSLASTEQCVMEAERLLITVRQIARDWVRLLRREVSSAFNVETAQKRSIDAFVAALLCRKTFVIEAARPTSLLSPDDLACFLECAFTIKENLPSGETGHISKLSLNLRKLYISDIKLVLSLEHQLKDSIQAQQPAVCQALNRTWGDEEGESSRAFSQWSFLSPPRDSWVTARTIAAHSLASQEVYFNLFDGTLLIDGQPVGQLPEEYTRQTFFQAFFGTRVFRTYPSGMPGMSYMLASKYEEHHIHFGYRDGIPFMRARSTGAMPSFLEYIPAEIFSSTILGSVSDLPEPLIVDQVHWLNIAFKQLIVRPRTSMWRSRPGDWVVNLMLQQAVRRRSLLIDPSSAIFASVASIIEPFESRSRMVIYQPHLGNLSLKLPSLELSFRVNAQGLLECDQLHGVVDSDQDIGAFYGMKSSLVLRDTTAASKRSILVAMGTATIEQKWGHPEIKINNDGYYARYNVNTLLGRLECACEPRLLYFKAYCHAITSSVIPDPLTGRTGTDEALHCLRAGHAQPWEPLDAECYRILLSIAALTPSRDYYPQNVKVLQKVIWKDILTSGVQHDSFRPIVEQILKHCDELYRFNRKGNEPPTTTDRGELHLLNRAGARHERFQVFQIRQELPTALDMEYRARDCLVSSSYQQAFETAFLVKGWPKKTRTNCDLAAAMHGLPLIEGFGTKFDCHLLSDLMTMDIASRWGSLFALCRDTLEARDKYRLMFDFSAMAFGDRCDMVMLRTLVAIAASEDFTDTRVPSCSAFKHFRGDEKPTVPMLMALSTSFQAPYPPDLRNEVSMHLSSKQRHQLEVAQVRHQELCDRSCRKFARHIVSQWPISNPSIDGLEEIPLFDVVGALESLKEEWKRLSDNSQFDEHLRLVRSILNRCDSAEGISIPSAGSTLKIRTPLLSGKFSSPSISDMISYLSKDGSIKTRPLLVGKCLKTASSGAFNNLQSDARMASSKDKLIATQPTDVQSKPPSRLDNVTADLRKIIDDFTSSGNSTRQVYGEDLRRSLSSLESHYKTYREESRPREFDVDCKELEVIITTFKDAVTNQFTWIRSIMIKNFAELNVGAELPDITRTSLLESLRSTSKRKGHTYEIAIIEYAELIRNLQRLIRIGDAKRRNDNLQLRDELRADALSREQYMENPDWYLLEIDFDLRIRGEQYQVARAMISPPDGSNSVLQLNMGQGKSSVIIPMIVAHLADAKNLVRVIVPRPLLLQAAQLLQGRLGGLIGRKISHVPFSRRSSSSSENIEAYQKLHRDFQLSRGVMLTLPEHVLSFQLSGLQELCNGHYKQADCMMRVHAWLKNNSRDILDESDHMLAVKTQLIYPSGAQGVVDGQPFRWTVVQALLKLTRSLLPGLRKDFPRNIEVIERSPGSFPTVYLLNQGVRDALLQRLTDRVLKGDGNILPVDSCTKDELESVRTFICNTRIPKAKTASVTAVFSSKTDARHQLLSVRGLLIHRILQLGLSKRWNVQYGIHPGRDPIAVPFRSKGIPSEQAEFGHPDVSIVLTCLSFYNTGLTIPQFSLTLSHLLRSDEPVREFDLWHQDVETFPDSLSSWNSINTDDETQTQQLWNFLRLQIPVVNYYLNHFVFPRYARTFKKKLTSSGWDIAMPQHTQDSTQLKIGGETGPVNNIAKCLAMPPRSLTVGFSGTNDNKGLLPLNIKQNDLPALSHTNAEVLTHLLQPRNRKYIRAADRYGKRLNEQSLLRMLKADNIRMLLDAGAQILELDNVSLAKEWLIIDTEAEAAVYFAEDGHARVLFRHGKTQPLAASPYLDNLGACVVYLDEAHTRGVDLKMPPNAKAALTLGIMQTKDHTVQAAMRLRQLAVSQSVVFYAPPEVHQSILNVCNKTERDQINSYDVVAWLLEQTCCTIEQLEPLYISQGLDYCRRQLSAKLNTDAAKDSVQRVEYLKVLEQAEHYSLEELYAPDHKVKAAPLKTEGHPELDGYVSKLNTMKGNLRDTGDAVQALAHQEVEQEREVEIEVETVREVKKPSSAKPLPQPDLQPAVRSFAETGRLDTFSGTFVQAFIALRRTAIGCRLGVNDDATISNLFVTLDFNQTVVTRHAQPRDQYTRAVHWILWSKTTNTALILSDFEADAILPMLRRKASSCTYLLTYSAPVTRAMLGFDKLNFYTVPALPVGWKAPEWLVCELGILAGRLYFDYDDQCLAVCVLMGLAPPPVSSTVSESNDLADSVVSGAGKGMSRRKPFSNNALLFMQEWLAVRRKGQDFSQTMMGEICRGKGVIREEKKKIVNDE